MSAPVKQQLVQQILAISAMERGKLSDYSFKERPGPSGPYHKLQSWRDGKNHTRHVPAEELSDVRAALAGYEQFQKLTRQYADLVVAETRQNLAASKKKRVPPTSSPLKTRKFSG